MLSSKLARQRGLTLIEFMISIVLGMILVAALATLIANQSTARSEIDRAGRVIENGRYSIQTITDDLQMAGYWGEVSTIGAYGGALPDPCDATEATVSSIIPFLHIQGYDDTTYTAGTLSCVSNWKSGTDILVVRYVDPDYTPYQTGGVTDLSKLTDGQLYLQSGLANATSTDFGYILKAGNSTNNATNFTRVTKTGAIATPRKVVVHIYYVATCDVCSGGAADTIPTLKRVELSAAAGASTMTTATISEGIEYLQIDYGRDSDGDGAPDSSDSNCSAFTVADWTNTMSAKIYLVSRATETSPGFSDTKTYALGTASSVTPAASVAGYQRHLFEQSVRLANPSMRRSG